MGIVESRKLLDWEPVKAFGRELWGKCSAEDEVKIIRPALPQV